MITDEDQGYLHRVTFSLRYETGDRNCYLSGNFNCFGDGSIQMELIEGNWVVSVSLLPGTYRYYFEINQYCKVNHNREVIGKPMDLSLKQTGIYHNPEDGSLSVSVGNMVVLRCITDPAIGALTLVTDGKKRISPENVARLQTHNIFEFVAAGCSSYCFVAETDRQSSGPFHVQHHIVEVPRSQVIYQIFPDRFYRSGSGSGFRPWNSMPDSKSFFGGNLMGIMEKLPYIKSLGVEHLYLNPFFASGSNHRYDVDDYFDVDQKLGTKTDLIILGNALRANGIHFIIDMVFNHTSTRFPQFVEAAKGADPVARKWYNFLDAGSLNCSGKNGKDAPNSPRLAYQCFKAFPGMPKLNHRNEEVRDLMMRVMEYYSEIMPLSFMRYDVADSIDLNAMKFILGKFRLKHPNIGHIAEIWCSPALFTTDGLYDGAINFQLRQLIIDLLKGRIGCRKFNSSLAQMRMQSPDRVLKNMMNIVGNHDTERIRTILGNRDAALLSYAILFMFDGMPTIYYGDETGLEGGKDPDCRRTMPWDSLDSPLIDEFRKLSEMRRKYDVMRSGYTKLSRKKSGTFDLIKRNGSCEMTLRFSLSDRKIRINGMKPVMSHNVDEDMGTETFSKYSFTITVREYQDKSL